MRLSRRELATAALAAAGVGAVGLDGLAGADTRIQSPAQILGELASLELLAVYAYQGVSAHPGLAPFVASVVRKYLAHEQQHVQVIYGQLGLLGSAPPPPPANAAAADALLSAHGGSASFSALHTQDDCLKILQQVEAAVQGSYYLAVQELADPATARVFAEIMAAEAQHSTSLTGLRHPGAIDRAVPYAFVEGSR